MIFLRDLNILFLKPRKVAGTSFEIALSKFAGPSDILAPFNQNDELLRRKHASISAQNYNFFLFENKLIGKLYETFNLKIPKKFYQHMSASKARKRLGTQAFNNAFKISIVRNPFDVVVSWYFWNKKRSQDGATIAEWIVKNRNLININDEQYKIGEEVVVNFFIRFEKFNSDIQNLENIKPEIAGISEAFATLRAKGNTRPKRTEPRNVLSDQENLVLEIKQANKFLIEKFGYDL